MISIFKTIVMCQTFLVFKMVKASDITRKNVMSNYF